jgi:diaminopimelate epimerase
MDIPFVKAEGAGNDFLITRTEVAPPSDRPEAARAICNRQMGVGADGWYLVRVPESTEAGGVDAEIHLYNSDGSEAELSGNGTRCVVAWLASIRPGQTRFQVKTGAGIRHLHLLDVDGYRYRIGMQMGSPVVFAEESIEITGDRPKSISGHRIDVGNPQFAVHTTDLDFPWKVIGEKLEGHPTFPNRSNISFYRPLANNRIEARFYERGAGATLSSGTGSTGALAAALHRGLVQLPAVVETEAGPLHFREDESGLVLEGSATLLAEGVFHWKR